ncbi:hypothetical protein ACJIZ3_022813 [Penstemon smallii]|uniref:Transmembrane protein n=1 Tax=Penstemon smallii TaxID=265156 RepID=A0ABD3TPD4_9LAMI
MLGFIRVPHTPILHSKKSKPLPPIFHLQNPNFRSLSNPKQFRVYAQNGNKNDELPQKNGINNGGNGENEKIKNEKPKLNLKWMDLLLNPEPDNILAVGLTGVLTWASVQVLWQLFVVSAAILIAALKYTIVAALLIFILITLL